MTNATPPCDCATLDMRVKVAALLYGENLTADVVHTLLGFALKHNRQTAADYFASLVKGLMAFSTEELATQRPGLTDMVPVMVELSHTFNHQFDEDIFTRPLESKALIKAYKLAHQVLAAA